MKIITTAVIKGGTGKTTTAAALAQAATADKKKVLAVDLDPQANLSHFIGAEEGTTGAYELLHGAEPAEVIQTTPQGMDAITADPDLATERTGTGSARRLRDALEGLAYDIIIIDTPPSIGELVYNALAAATDLLIPLETDTSSIDGLYHICEIAEQMKKSNPSLKIAGAVLTRYDGRPKLNQHLRATIEEAGEAAGAPLLATIRSGIAIREAQALQQNLYTYAPRSNPAADYKRLYKLLTN